MDAASWKGTVAVDVGEPLFIVGAPRSGTSLLYKLLCLHPEAAWTSNWNRRAPGVAAVAAVNRLVRRPSSRRRAVWFGSDAANAYVYGRRRSLWERLYPMPVEGEPLYEHCGIGRGAVASAAEGAQAESEQAACLRRVFAGLRRWSGGRVLISKRIANNQRIPFLVEAFPHARFVHLIRDGRAVAYSLSRVDWWEDGVVWWYGDTPRSWRERGGDPWELAATHWVRELASIEDGLRSVPAERQLELRYEALVEAPAATVTRVARFAGLGDRPRWRSELDRLSYPNRNEAWRDRLTPEARQRVEAIQRTDLVRLGHAD
jgi:Sulfotransferase family